MRTRDVNMNRAGQLLYITKPFNVVMPTYQTMNIRRKGVGERKREGGGIVFMNCCYREF